MLLTLEGSADPGTEDDSVVDVAGAAGVPNVLNRWLDVEARNDLNAVREFVHHFIVFVLAKRFPIFISELGIGCKSNGAVIRPRGNQPLVDAADIGLEGCLGDVILIGIAQQAK